MAKLRTSDVPRAKTPTKVVVVARDAKTGEWTQRDTASGRFLEVKQTGGSFKGVRRES